MMHSKRTATVTLFVALIGALFAFKALAQTPTGTIQGTVLDPNGATVPSCAVSARDVHTNSLRATTTGQNGFFAIPLLPTGSYELTVKMKGFKTYNRGPLHLDVNQKIDLPITLAIGAESQVITVTAQAPLLDTVTSSVGQVVGNQQINDMPLSNRNILQLDTFVPGLHDFGATVAPATSGSVGFGRYEANGGPTNSNEFMLDGATDVVANLNSTNVIPTIDAVQESQILTSNIPAEFGRTGAIVFNATYKSGTNQLHGTVYEFNNNSILAANTWVNDANHEPKIFSNINTFGFSLGGPVWIPKVFNGKNRLFFFTNYEGYRNVIPISMLLTVPTVAERGGDFSGLMNASGSQINVYDPTTTTLVSGNTYTRQQFSYNGVTNVIPPSRLDSVGVKLTSYYPLPNATPTNTFSNTSNYLTHTSAYELQNEWSVKIDYDWNEKNKLFSRYTSSYQGGGAADVFGNSPGCSECTVKDNPAGSYSPRGGGAALYVIPKNFVLGYTHVISPTTLLDLRAVVDRQLTSRVPQSTGFTLASLGMPSSLDSADYYKQFPPITVANFQSLGNYAVTDLLVRGDTTYSTNESLTLIRAGHSIKIGGDLRMFRYNESGGVSYTTPGFTFDQTWTQQNPFASNALQGAGLASMLIGVPTSGTYTNPAATALQWFYGALYVQDDWKVNSRLTLNLGIRYDIETPQTDRYNRATDFSTTVTNEATAVDPAAIGGLQFVAKNYSSRWRFPVNYRDFGPRFGLAYTVMKGTVFHAAYGILYQPIDTYGFGASNYGTQGYSATTTMVVSANGGLTPTNYIDSPFPGGYVQPTGNTLGSSTFLGQSITTQLRYGVRTPQMQQFSAGFEKQMGSTLIGVGYVGTHGVHEFLTYSLDQLTPANYALGSALAVQVANPFYGLITSGTLSTPTVARGQLLLPFPEFTGVTDNYASLGSMTYSSLQAKVEHRLSKGFYVLGAYTWGKNMGNVGERYANAMTYQNAYDLGLEESLSPLDIAQNLTAMATYSLPVGRGRLIGNDMPEWANIVAGGWELNGMFAVADGTPLLITSSINGLGYGAQVQRPNQNYNLSLKVADRTPSMFFNTAAFSAAPLYTYGNAKPYEGGLRGQGTDNVNLALDKNTNVRELFTLQFRAEFYNALNHSLWASPGTTYGSTSFGVSADKTNNRTGQLALKLIF
jgi:Carboxypeptidase regulatory-like domain/TonB dependent receptor